MTDNKYKPVTFKLQLTKSRENICILHLHNGIQIEVGSFKFLLNYRINRAKKRLSWIHSFLTKYDNDDTFELSYSEPLLYPTQSIFTLVHRPSGLKESLDAGFQFFMNLRLRRAENKLLKRHHTIQNADVSDLNFKRRK
jgi:hypothetical protein